MAQASASVAAMDVDQEDFEGMDFDDEFWQTFSAAKKASGGNEEDRKRAPASISAQLARLARARKSCG